MSKGSKGKYKRFDIINVTDACLQLGTLISSVTVALDKYKEYIDEANAILEKIEGETIDAKIYEGINDKLRCRQHDLLKSIADNQNSSFSYKSLRELLLKKKMLTVPLEDNDKELLENMLALRNWSFHNAQSNLIAAREVMEQRIPDELRSSIIIEPLLNPICIQKYTSYDTILFALLVKHAEQRVKEFDHILCIMKEDYQTLFASLPKTSISFGISGLQSEVEYKIVTKRMTLADESVEIPQISMAIQKSKYDGSKEAFDKCSVAGQFR